MLRFFTKLVHYRAYIVLTAKLFIFTGYADDHFNNWGVMTTACVRIAKRRGLDPKEQKDRSPFQRTSKSESEGERMGFARKRNEGRRFEAKVVDQNGDTRERPPMLCSTLPYQTVFTSGEKRSMPPRMGKRPNHNFCV